MRHVTHHPAAAPVGPFVLVASPSQASRTPSSRRHSFHFLQSKVTGSPALPWVKNGRLAASRCVAWFTLSGASFYEELRALCWRYGFNCPSFSYNVALLTRIKTTSTMKPYVNPNHSTAECYQVTSAFWPLAAFTRSS